MYHKMEVYRSIHHPFMMAWIEFENTLGRFKGGICMDGDFRKGFMRDCD